jgi:hypothetical protein
VLARERGGLAGADRRRPTLSPTMIYMIYSDSPALAMRMTKSSRRDGPVALALALALALVAAGARAGAEEVASTSRQKQRKTSTTTPTMIICMLVAKGGNLEAGGGSRLGLLVAVT